MNIVCLMGRLTREPEYREGNTNIARYTLAVDRMKEGTDFINCVCFGRTADFARNYLHKGSKIAITGRIQTGSYEGKNGTVYTTDVVVNSHDFAENRTGSAQEPRNGRGQVNTRAQTEKPVQGALDGFMSIPAGIDDELPFN